MDSAIDGLHRTARDRKGFLGNRSVWLKSDEEVLETVQEIATSDAMAHIVAGAKRTLENIETIRQAMNANDAEIAKLAAEFNRRGGWTRAFLAIVNGKGHVHRSMHCSTCNNGIRRTQFAWMIAWSDKTMAEIVADAGERACTVCYPSAPVNVVGTKMFSQDEIAAQKARDERAAAKAERDAKKVAAAITPDGSELKVIDAHGYGQRFKTERAATTWAVQNIGHHRAWDYSLATDANKVIIEAIATKHGKTVDEVTAEIEKKVTAWVKRNA
jgi:hypothetical protein